MKTGVPCLLRSGPSPVPVAGVRSPASHARDRELAMPLHRFAPSSAHFKIWQHMTVAFPDADIPAPERSVLPT